MTIGVILLSSNDQKEMILKGMYSGYFNVVLKSCFKYFLFFDSIKKANPANA